MPRQLPVTAQSSLWETPLRNRGPNAPQEGQKLLHRFPFVAEKAFWRFRPGGHSGPTGIPSSSLHFTSKGPFLRSFHILQRGVCLAKAPIPFVCLAAELCPSFRCDGSAGRAGRLHPQHVLQAPSRARCSPSRPQHAAVRGHTQGVHSSPSRGFATNVRPPLIAVLGQILAAYSEILVSARWGGATESDEALARTAPLPRSI
jgi:hypothetical protein